MEGGSDDDLLSLDQPVSTENGDKSLEGEGEKRGKGKDSEFRICITAKPVPIFSSLSLLVLLG